jgi:hypothetical protein
MKIPVWIDEWVVFALVFALGRRRSVGSRARRRWISKRFSLIGDLTRVRWHGG